MARDDLADPRFEIPDLGVPPADSKAPSAPRSGPGQEPKPALDSHGSLSQKEPSAAASAADLFGNIAAFDDVLNDDRLQAGIPLDLAEAPRAAMAAAEPAASPWPTGQTPHGEDLHLDPEAIFKIVSWGGAPQTWLECPTYAWLVFRGQRELRIELDRAQRELAAAEARRDTRLGTLAVERAADIADDPSFVSVRESLDRAHRAHADATSQSHAEIRARSEAKAQAVAATAAAQATLAERNQQLESAQRNVEQAELEARRERARLQRLHIEIRAIDQAAVKEYTAQARQERLKKEATTLEPLVAATEQRLEERRRQLRIAEEEGRRARLALREIEDRAGAASRASHPTRSTALSALEATEAAVRQARADIGRALLATRGRIALSDQTRDELLGLDKSVELLSLRCALLRAAQVSYDRAAVRKGVQLVVLLLALLVLFVLPKLVL